MRSVDDDMVGRALPACSIREDRRHPRTLLETQIESDDREQQRDGLGAIPKDRMEAIQASREIGRDVGRPSGLRVARRSGNAAPMEPRIPPVIDADDLLHAVEQPSRDRRVDGDVLADGHRGGSIDASSASPGLVIAAAGVSR